MLDSESKDTGGTRSKGDGGLGKLLAVGGDHSSSSSASASSSQEMAAPKANKGKHAARRTR